MYSVCKSAKSLNRLYLDISNQMYATVYVYKIICVTQYTCS